MRILYYSPNVFSALIIELLTNILSNGIIIKSIDANKRFFVSIPKRHCPKNLLFYKNKKTPLKQYKRIAERRKRQAL